MEAMTYGANSVFIVDSVLYDLEDLMNSDDDLPIKNQIKVIHELLNLLKPLCPDMKMAQQLEINELNKLIMQIVSVVYEVEYLINSFLVGDAQIWYLPLRLLHVINKLERLFQRINKLECTVTQEISKDLTVGVIKVFAEDSGGVQLSPQAKNDSRSNDVIVGFEDKEEEILNQLMGGTKKLEIVFISGMVGQVTPTAFHASCDFSRTSKLEYLSGIDL